MNTTIETTNTIKITLSNRRPITIDDDEWPIIAHADTDGATRDDDSVSIVVREHHDGRRIVYGWRTRATCDHDIRGGFLVAAKGGAPDEDETVRAIRRVAGILTDVELGARCIGSLPAEAI